MRWYEGAGAARLEHDKQIVADAQPGLRHILAPDGQMTLQGPFVVRTDSGVPHSIETRIDFPNDYPTDEPVAHEIGGRFKHDGNHHFSYESDQCCLWLDVASPWSPRDPAALGQFLDQLAIFYHRQLQMEADPSLPFPGPAAGHGGLGYIEHLQERWEMSRAALRRMRFALAGQTNPKARCPCGSGRRYRKCHQGEITTFLQKANRASVDQMLELLD